MFEDKHSAIERLKRPLVAFFVHFSILIRNEGDEFWKIKNAFNVKHCSFSERLKVPPCTVKTHSVTRNLPTPPFVHGQTYSTLN